MKKDTKKEEGKEEMDKKDGRGIDFEMQPILFTKDQYKELLRAFGAYTLLKQSSILPDSETARLYGYIVEQGKKFGFEKIKMDEMDWFEEINDEVYEALFQYTQEEIWQNLANLFARRDAIKEIEEETGLSEEELPPDMFLDSMAKRVYMYIKEFEKNGINNLTCPNIQIKLLNIKKIKKP